MFIDEQRCAIHHTQPWVLSHTCRCFVKTGDLSIAPAHSPARPVSRPIPRRRRATGVVRCGRAIRETIIAMANANRGPEDPTTAEPNATDEAAPTEAAPADAATTSTGVLGGVAKGLAWIGDKVRSVVKPKAKAK